MLNHIDIQGRLTKDPDLRYTQSNTPVISFSVACERDYVPAGQQRETDFIDVVAWKQTAEFVSKYFQKGSLIVVSGRIQNRDWTDRDGSKRRITEVIADRVYFCDSKRKEDSGFSEVDDFGDDPPF